MTQHYDRTTITDRPKLYPTRLTFSDIQRDEYSHNAGAAPDAKMEFADMNVPIIDLTRRIKH